MISVHDSQPRFFVMKINFQKSYKKYIIRISINSRCAKSIRITAISYELASEEWRTVNLNAIKKSVIRFAQFAPTLRISITTND